MPRAGRLGHEFVPIVRVGAQDSPVAHHECHADRVQTVLKQLEGPAEIALPSVGVPSEEQIEGPGTGFGEHLVHRWRAPDGGTALGNLEHQVGVDEAVALDEAILLLALAGWP